MSEAKTECGALVQNLTGTGTVSPVIVSPASVKTLTRGNIFSILGICDDGSPEILNHTSARCNACRWLHTKETIAWSGQCGKHVTVRHCLAWSPCQGPVSQVI
jgi:hypothetical protein